MPSSRVTAISSPSGRRRVPGSPIGSAEGSSRTTSPSSADTVPPLPGKSIPARLRTTLCPPSQPMT